MEHPAGQQGELAARYLLRNSSGDTMALMFEKGANTPANLWIAHEHVLNLVQKTDLNIKLPPALALYSSTDKTGEPLYGRHSTLKTMPELKHTDLIRIRISSVTELDRILDHLSDLSRPPA
ncbi:MAG TPA: hypothetical protein DIT67_01795 [Octadecabacter sp.]|nr:hypothetical protein [Octadecabacter sp.]